MAKRRRNGHLRKHDVRHGAKITLALLPALCDKPPAHQLSVGRLIASEWADPADMNALRREGRTVKGYRRACPVFAIFQRDGEASGITIEMLSAVHEMRTLFERASIGLSGERDLLVYIDVSKMPSAGPSKAALATMLAEREVRRVLKLYDEIARSMLVHVVCLSRSIESWREPRHIGHVVASRYLRQEVLAPLAEYFASDIERHGLAA